MSPLKLLVLSYFSVFRSVFFVGQQRHAHRVIRRKGGLGKVCALEIQAALYIFASHNAARVDHRDARMLGAEVLGHFYQCFCHELKGVGTSQCAVTRFVENGCGKVLSSRQIAVRALDADLDGGQLCRVCQRKTVHFGTAGEREPHSDADAVDELTCVEVARLAEELDLQGIILTIHQKQLGGAARNMEGGEPTLRHKACGMAGGTNVAVLMGEGVGQSSRAQRDALCRGDAGQKAGHIRALGVSRLLGISDGYDGARAYLLF